LFLLVILSEAQRSRRTYGCFCFCICSCFCFYACHPERAQRVEGPAVAFVFAFVLAFVFMLVILSEAQRVEGPAVVLACHPERSAAKSKDLRLLFVALKGHHSTHPFLEINPRGEAARICRINPITIANLLTRYPASAGR
jgi:hypothetical protein